MTEQEYGDACDCAYVKAALDCIYNMHNHTVRAELYRALERAWHRLLAGVTPFDDNKEE